MCARVGNSPNNKKIHQTKFCSEKILLLVFLVFFCLLIFLASSNRAYLPFISTEGNIEANSLEFIVMYVHPFKNDVRII